MRIRLPHMVSRPATLIAAIILIIALIFLWRAPSRAAETALVNVKLSGDMQPEGDVPAAVSISLDSQWVAYLADAGTDEAFELFVAPTTGQSPPIRVSDLLPSGSNVKQFAWTPDSNHLVYIAPAKTAGVDELFIVPTGGGMPLTLSGPLVSGGDVLEFLISPDSNYVIYRADQETDEVDELFSVPSGGGMPVKLSGPLISTADVTDAQVSPDSSHVVFRADRQTGQRSPATITKSSTSTSPARQSGSGWPPATPLPRPAPTLSTWPNSTASA